MYSIPESYFLSWNNSFFFLNKIIGQIEYIIFWQAREKELKKQKALEKAAKLQVRRIYFFVEWIIYLYALGLCIMISVFHFF